MSEQSTNESNSRNLVNANINVLDAFIMGYVLDNGVGVQMIETISREILGDQSASTDMASQLFSTAAQDVVKVGLLTETTFDLQRVIEGAASLEFLVRMARKVNPAIIPTEVIPSDELVAATLVLFHERKRTSVR